jgi:POT family proton-dependent oligopeptide transporter
MTESTRHDTPATLFGHPAALFTLFFAEMWERFSYYGMRALLLFYMLKGFLQYGDSQAYAVYGAYTALVYMTPFFGGMIADRLLGTRRAVVLGGLLMASGHLMMAIENTLAFYVALALLITGNGFFKPNVSTMVGSLYPTGSPKRDGGFTIFYMGINLGAAMSPLLCGYIGETYGWHWGFGLATIGMLTGIAVFVAPVLITQLLIMAGALAAAVGLLYFRPDNAYSMAINVFVAISLLSAAVISWLALQRGGLPPEVGAPPDRERLSRPIGGISTEWLVYLGALAAIPVLALLVSGFSPFTEDRQAISIIPESSIQSVKERGGFGEVAAVVMQETSKPAGLILFVSGLVALIYLGLAAVRLERIPRQRMYVVFVLTFFSMLFWAFFEQAGSSVNNFTDRNVNRVIGTDRTLGAGDVGQKITIQPSQLQLGYHNGEQMFTLTQLDRLRDDNKDNPAFTIPWTVAEDNVGMSVTQRNREIPASWFQSINPVFILIFGLVFTALWSLLARRGWEPNTAVKFAFGLLQLGVGFGAFWYGAEMADERGMVRLSWLFVGYLFQTTGELCISPVGLSMVTKLSPAFLVSTVMGMWFLATAFSQFLAAIIAQFTGVGEGSEGTVGVPIPRETVHVYGDVFYSIAVTALGSGLFCLALSPLLSRWMHEETEVAPAAPDDARHDHE